VGRDEQRLLGGVVVGRVQAIYGGCEVARGLSLFGGASSEVRRCNSSVVV